MLLATLQFSRLFTYMRIAEICHYLSSIQRWDNFSSVVDNLQDVLVEEGQGGKGQKIQEDSAGKTMVLLSLLAYHVIIISYYYLYYCYCWRRSAKGRRFKRTDDGDGDNGYSGDANTWKQGQGVDGQWSWWCWWW